MEAQEIAEDTHSAYQELWMEGSATEAEIVEAKRRAEKLHEAAEAAEETALGMAATMHGIMSALEANRAAATTGVVQTAVIQDTAAKAAVKQDH